ncbi:flavin-containing monooxygenase FMO GS-OX-like 3 [Photinus pyralis]|uniref:Flavin-containing monooxygenase n=1 Tax=Photinus pyralis TaxID=7054 RepID=A0A1Y1N8R3_PHOPY|nr:flavin-containing monooxygenase FMO GS-OX-like 3 [Photinus pyralis]
MKIAIIGAGPSGLVSTKYSLDEGHEIDVYEQSGYIGGTWMYTDRIGVDEYGFPVHSSMYKGLMTNVPKEIMTFLDFPYPKQQTKSYISQQEVIKYFNQYADTFHLKEHIKFYKRVTKIAAEGANGWCITAQDAKTKLTETQAYDAVFICTGHYSVPYVPKLPGHDQFTGEQVHSHNFRTCESFKGKNVLVIGGSSSGVDIAGLISKVANKVVLCYRSRLKSSDLDNVEKKQELSNITPSGVVFRDGTEDTFDTILYCTGYKYSFPFLTEGCDIRIENNWVKPLYKHIVNINHPTMCFIGIPYYLCEIPALDIEVRFALAAVGGKFSLPPKEEMLRELEEQNVERLTNGLHERYAHRIKGVQSQEKYFKELSSVANIRPMPIVLNKILDWVDNNKRDLTNCIKIIDSENFVQFKC